MERNESQHVSVEHLMLSPSGFMIYKRLVIYQAFHNHELNLHLDSLKIIPNGSFREMHDTLLEMFTFFSLCLLLQMLLNTNVN